MSQDKVVIDPKYTKLKRRTKMEQFAVLLTEERSLWYYLEATDDESALDEAKAMHKEWVDNNDISGGADDIEWSFGGGSVHELAQY